MEPDFNEAALAALCEHSHLPEQDLFVKRSVGMTVSPINHDSARKPKVSGIQERYSGGTISSSASSSRHLARLYIERVEVDERKLC